MPGGLRGTLLVLAGLVLGLALGAWVGPSSPELGIAASAIGGLWLDALKMTVVPLVFGLLVTGVLEAAATAASGGMAARALGWFAVLLTLSGLFSVTVSPLLLEFWPVSAAEAQQLMASHGSAAAIPPAPPLAEWLRSFIPTNPVGAAANGAMVPLVVFALVFGLAAARIEPGRRDALFGVLDAIVQAMLVIIHWVLRVAPIGVAALAVGVGAALGGGAFGLLGHYIALLVTVQGLLILLVYPFAVIVGRLPLPAFIRALAPVQLVAISTQSSLACLPGMVEAATELGIAEPPRRLVLPLAVSLFKITSPCANLAVIIYSAHVFGVPVGLPQALAGIGVALAVAVASVGLPGGTSFFLACVPIAAAMGVPADLLPLLLAVEVIPDIFRTIGNVTGDVAVTAAVGRSAARNTGLSAPIR
jgi:Na+/H+-dicarboxylate symporter